MTSHSPYNEKELLARAAAGDQRAFNGIVRHYSRIIYPYLFYWLKDSRHAEEVAQDVFIRLWKNRSKLPGIGNFPGYVYVMTRNCVYSELQRELPAPPAPDIEPFDEVLSNPHSALELKELAALMEKAIGSLPPRRREIFLLSRTEGLTYEEIAQRLGISRSTVREHIVEALVFLRHYLKKNAGIIISLLQWLLWVSG